MKSVKLHLIYNKSNYIIEKHLNQDIIYQLQENYRNFIIGEVVEAFLIALIDGAGVMTNC